MSVPKKIFIVPYRNRHTHRVNFINHMNDYLKEETGWEIYFAHQCDERPFNRGAMKNIGFIAAKTKYPRDYGDITFIFHDVDTWPATNGIINYDTTDGIVKHYYGYEFALGGMFSIKGKDFEKTLGFPNFWGWGLEDNVIQDRCKASNLIIDRSNFFPISDKINIHREDDGAKRLVSKADVSVYKWEKPDNITDIRDLNYKIENDMINITKFNVKMNVEDQDFYIRDNSKEGTLLKIPKGYRRKNWSMTKIYKR